jgi:hypothetical protein
MKKYAVSVLSFIGGMGIGVASIPMINKLNLNQQSKLNLNQQSKIEKRVVVDKEPNPSTTSPLETLGLPRLENDLIKRSTYSLQYNREKRNAWWAGEYLEPSSTKPLPDSPSHKPLPDSPSHKPLPDSPSHKPLPDSPSPKPNRSKSHFKEDPLIPNEWRSKVKEVLVMIVII